MNLRAIKENMEKVLHGHGQNVYTVVSPSWPDLTENQKSGESTIEIPSIFYNDTAQEKSIEKCVSIATGDGCLSPLYLLWVRDMNTRGSDI